MTPQGISVLKTCLNAGLTAALLMVVRPTPAQVMQLPDFPGSKAIVDGTSVVVKGLPTPTLLKFKITVNVGFDPNLLVMDTVPAEWDVANLIPSCGTATAAEINKPGDKLRPDVITWNLSGCTNGVEQTLEVWVVTDKNPGHAKRGIDYYEPTSCGPLWVNHGAYLFDSAAGMIASKRSNALKVAAGKYLGDVDADGDGWSVGCGDCNDVDPLINPGAVEVCDGIDNNCNGLVDEGFDCPLNLPAPVVGFDYVHTELIQGVLVDYYELNVTNYAAFPDCLFVPTPDYGPCGLNTTPSRTWADIYAPAGDPATTTDDTYIYGFCALGQASDLNAMWFGVTHCTPPPSQVYVVIWDRKCNVKYTSNLINIPFTPCP